MSEETTPAPVAKEPDNTFTLQFEIPADMLQVFAKIGLEVFLKQKLQDVSNTVKQQ